MKPDPALHAGKQLEEAASPVDESRGGYKLSDEFEQRRLAPHGATSWRPPN